MEVIGEDYRVWYEPIEKTIYCQGSLRLAGTEEYAPIIQLLDQAIAKTPDQLHLDLCQLEFLNSSGINVLSKFVIKVRQQESLRIIVKGAVGVPWQGKSLKNLQRLMPTLQLAWINQPSPDNDSQD